MASASPGLLISCFSAQNNDIFPLNDLPDLVCLRVTQHCGEEALRALYVVNKRWNRLLRSCNSIWHDLLVRTLSEDELPRAVMKHMREKNLPWRSLYWSLKPLKAACCADVFTQGSSASGPKHEVMEDSSSLYRKVLKMDGRSDVDFSLTFEGVPAGSYTLVWHVLLQRPFHRGYLNFKASFSRCRREKPRKSAISSPRGNASSLWGPRNIANEVGVEAVGDADSVLHSAHSSSGDIALPASLPSSSATLSSGGSPKSLRRHFASPSALMGHIHSKLRALRMGRGRQQQRGAAAGAAASSPTSTPTSSTSSSSGSRSASINGYTTGALSQSSTPRPMPAPLAMFVGSYSSDWISIGSRQPRDKWLAVEVGQVRLHRRANLHLSNVVLQMRPSGVPASSMRGCLLVDYLQLKPCKPQPLLAGLVPGRPRALWSCASTTRAPAVTVMEHAPPPPLPAQPQQQQQQNQV